MQEVGHGPTEAVLWHDDGQYNINHEVFRRTGFAPNRRRSVGDLRDDERQYSQMRIKEVSRALFALDIRFRRIISSGGMGMASLFEVQQVKKVQEIHQMDGGYASEPVTGRPLPRAWLLQA